MDEQVVEILRGYARANEFLERERIRRLKIMTVPESRTIFDELVSTGEKQLLDKDRSNQMLQWRLQSLVALRRSFAALARTKGWI